MSYRLWVFLMLIFAAGNVWLVPQAIGFDRGTWQVWALTVPILLWAAFLILLPRPGFYGLLARRGRKDPKGKDK